MERKYAWHNYDDATMEKVYALSDTYRQFLDNVKQNVNALYKL